LGAAGTIINSLFSSDAWNNVTFIAGEIKEPKRIYHEAGYFDCHRYLYPGKFIWLFYPWHSGASDIANGIMFASNDQ
jgi:APA family basic amino acid/polyamine antiporter